MGKSNGVHVATESFSAEIDGTSYAIVKGETRIRGDHPLLEQNPDYFKPVEEELTFETADHRPTASRRGPEPERDTAPGQDESEAPQGDGLSEGTRAELNDLAASLGVEEPEKLANKDAVIAVIRAKQAE